MKQDTINFIKNEINTSTCLAVEVDEFEEELLDSYTNKPLSHQHNPLLTVIENKKLESLLEINKHCFALDLLDLKPPIGSDKHRINTITNVPIKLFAYRKSYHDREILNDQITTMLKANIIRHSNGPWSFPVVLVGKSDKIKRLCVNYKRLNDITKNDPFPIPLIGDRLDRVGSSLWFSDLDLKSGYWQIEMHADDMQKTAFTTQDGQLRISTITIWFK